MELRNKKNGEIVNSKELLTDDIIIDLFSKDFDYFNSKLDKIQEEWEVYEEPKEYYWIDYDGKVKSFIDLYEWQDKMKEIGNYFETKEEAEKAVEKLKAVKRLKDNGFRFKAYQLAELNIKFFLDHGYTKMGDDLDLLFGGEDE